MAQSLLDATDMSKKIIIIGAALIALGGGAGCAWFFFPHLLGGKEAVEGQQESTEKETKKERSNVTADLDTFVVNLAGSGPGRYLRTTLSLSLKEEKDKESMKEMLPRIRHALIIFLTAQQVEDLLSTHGKTQIRAEMAKQINEAVEKEMVEEVYFKEFLIQ